MAAKLTPFQLCGWGCCQGNIVLGLPVVSFLLRGYLCTQSTRQCPGVKPFVQALWLVPVVSGPWTSNACLLYSGCISV